MILVLPADNWSARLATILVAASVTAMPPRRRERTINKVEWNTTVKLPLASQASASAVRIIWR